MLCPSKAAEGRTIRFSPQQASRFGRMLKNSIKRFSGHWNERPLRDVQAKLGATAGNGKSTASVPLEVSLEEAFDLVQSLATCMYEDDWSEEDQHVYDELLIQLARDPFSCCDD